MGVVNRVHPPGGQYLPTLRACTLGIPLLGLCLTKMLTHGPRDLLVDNPCTITGKSRNTEAGYKPVTVVAELVSAWVERSTRGRREESSTVYVVTENTVLDTASSQLDPLVKPCGRECV